MLALAGCTVTLIDVREPQDCDKQMSVEVFGKVVLHTCEEDFDPDGKLTP